MTEVPTVTDGAPGDPIWYPLQHALGIDTFGVNLFVSTRSDQALVEEHDESKSGQQELYIVLGGTAVFALDGEQVRLESGTAVAVTDPSVLRSAIALAPATQLLVVGAAASGFASTWHPDHFEGIPRQ
jgi:hypothetical protein